MDNVKILDCTLRDGGYYKNWDFSTNFAKNYLKVLSKTSVNIIEIDLENQSIILVQVQVVKQNWKIFNIK